MKKFYVIILVIFCSIASIGFAQPQFYNKNNSTASNSIPLGSTTTNKMQCVYAPGTFSSLGTGNGTPAGAGLINAIYVRFSAATANATYTNFAVRMGQVMGTDTIFPANVYQVPMTTCLGPSSLTLTGVVAGGWYQIPLTNPYVYDPTKSLVVEIEQQSYVGTAASMYMNTAIQANNKRIYGLYAGPSGTLANGQYDLGIDIAALPACTNPPTAGTVTASTSAACAGQSFNLNLVGGTVGSSQTYQWESSTDSITWTPIAGQTSTFAVLTQSATSYYRCAITCGTTVYSNAVKIYSPSTPMSGTYTINKALATGGTNFKSFNDLALELNCVGVSGPVTVNVVAGSGPYIEQVKFSQAVGVSSTNTITINGNNEKLSFVPTFDNYILALDGADYMTFDNLNIIDSSTLAGVGISITNGANRNKIQNCTIAFPINTSTGSSTAAISLSGALGAATTVGFTGNQNRILNNTINGSTTGGPYYGITFVGLADVSGNNGNEIKGNIINNYYVYGLYISNSSNLLVEGNDLLRPTKTTLSTAYGAAIYNLNPNLRVIKNKIHNLFDTNPASTSSTYPFYFSSGKGNIGQEVLVANNLVYNVNNNGTIYGCYLSGAKNINIYHNTFNYDMGTAGTIYGYYFTTTPDSINLKNNILKISRSGTAARYGYYMSAVPSIWSADNNDISVDAGSGSGTAAVGYISTAARTTLADWQLASLKDAASVSVLPVFADPANGDLKPGAAATNNSGTDLLAIVPDDFYGVARTTTPDMGAIEYTPLNNEAGVTEITNGICPTPDSIFVKVKNYGIDPLTSIKVYANVNGVATPQNGTTFAVNVLPGLDTILNMGVFTFTAGSTPTIQAYTSLPNGFVDANYSNDTLLKTFSLGLSGNYTINSAVATGGTNYQSLTEVQNALNTYGICGPVVFDVVAGSGPYVNQQVKLNEVVGSSAINTITFHGHNETTSFLSTNTNQRAQFLLNGTDYVTIDSFIIIAQATASTQYGFGIHLVNEADHNNIIGNKIYLDSTLNSSTLAGIAISGNANSATTSGTATGNYNLVMGNYISGGYYGITLIGTSTTVHKTGNTVVDNEVRNFFYYGIYCYYQDSAKIEGNILKGGSNATYVVSVPSTQYGANVYYNNYPSVQKNKIELNATTTQYGVYVYYTYGLSGTPVVVANNFVSCLNASGTVYGIYTYNNNYVDFIHNSIFVNGGSATAGRGIYINSSTTGYGNVRFFNNIAVNSGPGYAVEISNGAHTAGYISAMDYNDWYGNTTNPFRYNNANHATLAAWKTASGKDANSLSTNPLFASTTDLHISSNVLNDRGMVGLGINEDIDGDVRCPNAGCAGSTLKPDIGADEFLGVPILVDVKVLNLDSTLYKSCYTNHETIKVKIKNNASQTLDFTTNPVTIYASVSGAVTYTFDSIVLAVDSLLPDSTMYVTIADSFDMSMPGNYNFTVISYESTDGNMVNDTIHNLLAFNVGEINNSYQKICGGSNYQLLMNNINGPIQWQSYDATTSSWINETGIGNTNIAYTVMPTTTTIYRAMVCGAYPSANDTIEVLNLVSPTTINDTLCGGGAATLIASPTGSGNVNWYSDLSTITPVFTGDTFNTTVSATDTFYASYSEPGGISPFGAPNTNISGTSSLGGQNTTTGAGIRFDVASPNGVTIYSIDVYPTAVVGSTISIGVFVGTSTTPIASYTTVTTVQGSATNPIAQTIPVNFYIPQGTGYQIRQHSSPTPSALLLRNYISTPSGYQPSYSIPGVITMTGSVLSSYYYYFYNWQVSSVCETPRVPVYAVVNTSPTVSLGNDTAVCSPNTVVLDAANAGATYMWTDMSTAQTLTASATGTYGVLVTDANGCMGADTVMVTVNTSPTVSLGNDTAVCSPNTVMLDAGNAGAMFMWTDMSTAQTLTASATGTYGVLVTDANGCMGADTVMVTVNALPVVNLGADITQCGGTATLDAANAGATYMWTDMTTAQTLTASATGTYGVLVKDANGCVGADTVNVTINTVPTVSLGNDTAVCAPNTVMLDAGNAGATYAWSNAATTQTTVITASGTYSVVVTAPNSCTATDAVVVTVNALPVVNLGADISQCGGTATLDAGNAGSTYAWSNAATTQTTVVSVAGSYNVVVTDANGCKGLDTINITVNSLPVVNLGADTARCGGSITLNAGNAGATYAWSNAAITQTTAASSTGNYSVVVTDANGCKGTDTIHVTINALPTVTFSFATDSICNNAAVVTLSGTPASGSFSGAGVTGSSFNAATAGLGTHTVTYSYTDANGCTGTASDMIVVKNCTGINDVNKLTATIYPTPTTGIVNIRGVETTKETITVKVYDMQGKLVSSQTVGGINNVYQIDVTTVASGVYNIQIATETGNYTGRIVRE